MTEMKTPQLLPSFFIVGAPKAGTTALYDYLAGHPEVCMSSDKEPNYFSHREINTQGLYYQKRNPQTKEEYLALFRTQPGHLIAGEGSVSYLFYPEVAARIHAFNPTAKIIISLRDPVQRAFSHYQMDYSLGLVKATFDEIVEQGATHPSLRLHYQQYIALGMYYQQVKRYLDLFPANQVLLLLHEDLLRHPDKQLRLLSSFLGIRYDESVAAFRQINVSGAPRSGLIKKLYQNESVRKFIAGMVNEEVRLKIKSTLFSKKNLPQLSTRTAQALQQQYAADLQQLSLLINKPLHHWAH